MLWRRKTTTGELHPQPKERRLHRLLPELWRVAYLVATGLCWKQGHLQTQGQVQADDRTLGHAYAYPQVHPLR